MSVIQNLYFEFVFQGGTPYLYAITVNAVII